MSGECFIFRFTSLHLHSLDPLNLLHAQHISDIFFVFLKTAIVHVPKWGHYSEFFFFRYLDTVQHTEVILHNVVDVHLQALLLTTPSSTETILANDEVINNRNGDDQNIADDDITRSVLEQPESLTVPPASPFLDRREMVGSSEGHTDRSEAQEADVKTGEIETPEKDVLVAMDDQIIEDEENTFSAISADVASKQIESHHQFKRRDMLAKKSSSCVVL